MDIITETGFRCHFLMPNKLIGPLRSDHESWWIRIEQRLDCDLYYVEDNFIFSVRLDHKDRFLSTRVTMRTEVDLWINEPGIMVIVAGGGTWRGIGTKGQYTTDALPLKQKDAHIGTVHFSRHPKSNKYTVGVEYKEGTRRVRWFCGDGFATRFRKPRIGYPEWKGAKVGGEPYELVGVYERPEDVFRWELAGKRPDIGQMYFLGATNGPSCIVNEKGRNDGKSDRIYNPKNWRFMPRHSEISQVVRKEIVAPKRRNK
jgi:hypothetical protein